MESLKPSKGLFESIQKKIDRYATYFAQVTYQWLVKVQGIKRV